jgi:hypothetical protein
MKLEHNKDGIVLEGHKNLVRNSFGPRMAKERDALQKLIGPPFCMAVLLNLWMRSEVV